MDVRRIIFVGDSHIHAVQAGLARTAPRPGGISIEAYRISTLKNGVTIGDLTFEEALDRARALSPDDLLVTLLRGNQFNSMGLIQHPRPFDLIVPEVSELSPNPAAEIIPLQTMRAYFERTLRTGYGKQLLRFAEACGAQVACLAPPAPKEDTDHIMRNAETYFRDHGVSDFGVTPAIVRLKLWTLQQQALASFCKRHDLLFFGNPTEARDEAGYLRRQYYARDATHGNAGYGELVLQQIGTFMDRRDDRAMTDLAG